MTHGYLLWLAGGAALAAVVVHQLLVDSPLFEHGAGQWFPAEQAGASARTLARLATTGALPVAGTLVTAWLVVETPFRTWLWAVVGVVALTDVVSPLLAAQQLRCRPPTDDERATLAAVPTGDVRVCVVDDAGDGPVNGYAVGGPFADVVGVSREALANLDVRRLGALVAHERGHHRLRHGLVRAGASAAWLVAVAAALTWQFRTLSAAALAGVGVLVAGERLVAGVVTRRTEYAADAYAARRTDPDAMVDLLATLRDAGSPAVTWRERLFSTHPTYRRRIARLRRTFDDGGGRRSDASEPGD